MDCPIIRVKRGPARPLSQVLSDFEQHVKLLYHNPADMPFHNLTHIQEILISTDELADKCLIFGIPVDKDAVRAAALGHDVLFFTDPGALGFSSKEELAANYSFQMLIKLGAPDEFATKVYRIILATRATGDPKTVEESLLRAADLKNVGDSYEVFRANAEHIVREQSMLSGTTYDFNTYAIDSLRYLAMYAMRFLVLTSGGQSEERKSAWHTAALSNCIRLFSEVYGGREKIEVVAAFTALPVIEVSQHAKPRFMIVFEFDSAKREALLETARSITPAKDVIFVVPGSTSNASLADHSCDAVYLPRSFITDPAALKEPRRIVKEGNDVTFY